VKEDWEYLFLPPLIAGFVFWSVIYLYQPCSSIEHWATEEAHRRIAARKANGEE